MSSKLSSPTAQLLRSSRLFSLPAALPRATTNFTDVPQSDSATSPYPLQQAIVTTPTALGRGDWGLKRPLPFKATARTSTPTVRINAVDTIEHITDFESAADLTITLRRIEELNLPITQPVSTGNVRSSAFENASDNTDPATTDLSKTKQKPVDHFGGFGLQSAEASRKALSRWKHKGPWVAGMTRGDFEAYVTKELRNRKDEFMDFLRERFAEELRIEGRRRARAEGTSKDDESHQPRETEVGASDAAFAEYVKKLRGKYDLNTNLAKYVSDFLDLPSLGSRDELGIGNLTAERQPPPTHPSAGLSYLRSDSHLTNHPILGPRARSTPAEGRVVAPIKGVSGRNSKPEANISVAGVVAQLMSQYEEWLPSNTKLFSSDVTRQEDRRKERTQMKRLGVDAPGGHRGWVEPSHIGIDSRGRISMKIANADRVAAAAHNGELVENIRSEAQKKRPIAAPLFSIPEQTVRKFRAQQNNSSNNGTLNSNVAYDLVKDLRDSFNRNENSTNGSSAASNTHFPSRNTP